MRAYPWQRQLLCLAPLWLLLGLVALFVGTGDDVTRYFTALREEQPSVALAMGRLTDWSLRFLYLVWAGLLLYCLVRGEKKNLRRFAFFVLVQVGVNILAVLAVKWAVGRPRPLAALEGAPFTAWSTEGRQHSFPSGHTAEASGAGLGLALWNKGWTPALGLIIAFVGFSRIYLSRHHLADVAAASLVGLLASLLLFHLCHRETP